MQVSLSRNYVRFKGCYQYFWRFFYREQVYITNKTKESPYTGNKLRGGASRIHDPPDRRDAKLRATPSLPRESRHKAGA